MIVSGLPIWIVFLFAFIITAVYYFRYKNTSWMKNWLIVLLIFAIHFFFFAWGIIIFLATEIIRGRANKKEIENSK